MNWWENNSQNEHIKKNFDNSDFDNNVDLSKKNTNEYNNLKSTKKIKIKVKDIRIEEKLKKQALDEVINELPNENEYIHIVSNGNFDYFKIIPRILQLSKQSFYLYASTWTMNYDNIDELAKLTDLGLIIEPKIFVGDYLRNSEPLVFEHLKQNLYSNNGKLVEFKNHCKIIVLRNENYNFALEMSANFTANRRTEQILFTNNKQLADFHCSWMDELLQENES